MKKIQEHKKLVIIAMVVLLAIVVLFAVLFAGKNNEKPSDKLKQETQVDDEGGLEISDPEEADKKDSQDKVEFVGPDGTVSDTSDKDNAENGDKTESGGNATSGGDAEDGGNTDDTENTDNSDREDDLDEEADDTDKYGSFF